MSYLYALGYLVALFVMSLVQRRFPKLMLLLFGVLPILLTPWWLSQDQSFADDPFTWVKLASVCVAVVWYNTIRIWEKAWSWSPSRLLVLLIMVGNIGEAVVTGILDDGLYVNGAAGLGLIAAIFIGHGPRTVTRSDDDGKDLLWDIPVAWFVAYSVWQLTFIFVHFNYATLEHIAILLAAIVVGAMNPKLWLQARAVTLAAHLVLVFSFEAAVDTMRVEWESFIPTLSLPAQIAALLVTGWAVAAAVKQQARSTS